MSWKASAYIKSLVECPNGERISRSEKLVALVLADSHQDKSTAYTFPSVATIAEDALMDERVCRRLLSSLERKGVIVRERGNSQGRGQMTFYRFPALDGAAKGGHVVPLSAPKSGRSFLSERGTEGGRKGDKSRTALKEEQEQEPKQLTPLSPSRSEGAKSSSAAIERAVDSVTSALGIANRRKRRLLRDVLELEAQKGDDLPTVALRMIAAWRKQADSGPMLSAKYGLAKFFGDGIWKDERRWHWNEDLLRKQSEAAVGTWRPN